MRRIVGVKVATVTGPCQSRACRRKASRGLDVPWHPNFLARLSILNNEGGESAKRQALAKKRESRTRAWMLPEGPAVAEGVWAEAFRPKAQDLGGRALEGVSSPFLIANRPRPSSLIANRSEQVVPCCPASDRSVDAGLKPRLDHLLYLSSHLVGVPTCPEHAVDGRAMRDV